MRGIFDAVILVDIGDVYLVHLDPLVDVVIKNAELVKTVRIVALCELECLLDQNSQL